MMSVPDPILFDVKGVLDNLIDEVEVLLANEAEDIDALSPAETDSEETLFERQEDGEENRNSDGYQRFGNENGLLNLERSSVICLNLSM